jgi:hypothetical protein
MEEPGLDEHEWRTEWEQIETDLRESPVEALADADDLIARMMQARGFPLEEGEDAELAEPDVVRSFEEARRITRSVDDVDRTFDPGDVPVAVEAYSELYAYLIEYGASSGIP